MSGEILNFYTDCAPSYVINSKLFIDRIEFYYSDKTISSATSRCLCKIDLNDQKTSLLVQNGGGFKFHLLKASSNFLIGLNEQNSVSTLYKYTIGSTSSPDLFSTYTSHIILLDSFQLKVNPDPLNLLLSDNTEKAKLKTHLLVVTRCGRVNLYEDDLNSRGRVSLLEQSEIKDCVKFNNDLVYGCENGAIYAVKLSDLVHKRQPTLKSNLVRSNIQLVKFQIDNNVLFALTKSGRKIELDINKTETSRDPELNGKDLVRQSITNLTQKAAQIVNMQLKLDIINTTLKQINLIKTADIQVEKKIHENLVRVELMNNSLTLQDPAQCYNLVLVLSVEGYQTVKQVPLSARRPSMRQLVDLEIKKKSYSSRLSVYLVFNCSQFIKESVKSMNHQSELSHLVEETYSSINDLVVCLHSSCLGLSSYMSESSIESNNTTVLYKLLAEYYGKEKLDSKPWTKIEVNGLDKPVVESLLNTKQVANSRLAYENLTIGVSEQTGDKFKLNIGIDSINPAALLKSVCFMNEIKHQFLNKDVLMPLLDKYTTDEELKRVLVGNRSLQIEKFSQRLNKLSAELNRRTRLDDHDDSSTMDYENVTADHQNSTYSIQTLYQLIDIYLTLRSSFSKHV